MFQRGSFTLFRVRGVPLRVHWSLLLILPYIAVVFSGYFARVASVADVSPERIHVPPLFWGALLAIGLFASIALHELAHTMVAIRNGGKVRDITLMLIGGVSSIERMPRSWKLEATMAAAGPLASFAIAAVLLAINALIPHTAADPRMGLFYLANANLVLGVFNLLPAFPMDGGRVLRGLLESRLGHTRATRIAASVGRGFAILIGILGLWSGNYLLLLVALFVYSGARAEEDSELVHDTLRGLRIADVMGPPPPAVRLDAPLDEIPARMQQAGRVELLVVDDQAHAIGLVRARDLASVPARERPFLHVRDLRDRVTHAAVVATPDEDAEHALERAGAAGTEFVIAVDPSGAWPVGLVGPREMERAFALRSLAR
jgi:Zn-dependent protease